MPNLCGIISANQLYFINKIYLYKQSATQHLKLQMLHCANATLCKEEMLNFFLEMLEKKIIEIYCVFELCAHVIFFI